ncbi:MAG: hypothetical protein KF862_16660 [Chitinophagaceae bacterium]|nr:hypothetical protein [Chitinophagaceae bacterium]
MGDTYLINFTRGNKLFEVTNHLGNVMLTVTDKREPVPVSGNPSVIASYKADVMTAADYSPFGMTLPGRAYNNHWQKYRYGFNGKESDSEVNGPYNELDYGNRVYEPRLGRFFSVDKLYRKYPFYSPYHFAGNSPIANIDLDGLEPYGANDHIYSDAPHRKYQAAALSQPKIELDPLTKLGKGFLKKTGELLVGMVGLATNLPAAAEYGDKTPDHLWESNFPALPNKNLLKDVLVPIVTTPVEVLMKLNEDPSNPEYWGEAAAMFFVYSQAGKSKGALSSSIKVNDIALGLNERGSLKKFAFENFALEQTEWKGYFRLDRSTTFINNFKSVSEFVVDNGGRIKFDLTKFDWNKAAMQIGKDPYSKEGSFTVAELEHIMGNKKLFDATDFYKGGKKIDRQGVIRDFNQAKNNGQK